MFSLAFLKPMYTVLSAESCSDGDTQQPAAAPANQKATHPSSLHLLYPVVNEEVEQQGRDIASRETCLPTSLNINDLGKAAVLHLTWASHNPLPTPISCDIYVPESQKDR
jgi:hypothetical protein